MSIYVYLHLVGYVSCSVSLFVCLFGKVNGQIIIKFQEMCTMAPKKPDVLILVAIWISGWIQEFFKKNFLS